MRFTISWKDGAYYVNVPRYDGGEVVTADEVADLDRRLRDQEYHRNRNAELERENAGLRAVNAALERMQERKVLPVGPLFEQAALQQRIVELERQLQKARADSWCDVCCGTGDPKTGKPCICGGSGLAQDAVRNLRDDLSKIAYASGRENPTNDEGTTR